MWGNNYNSSNSNNNIKIIINYNSQSISIKTLLTIELIETSTAITNIRAVFSRTAITAAALVLTTPTGDVAAPTTIIFTVLTLATMLGPYQRSVWER